MCALTWWRSCMPRAHWEASNLCPHGMARHPRVLRAAHNRLKHTDHAVPRVVVCTRDPTIPCVSACHFPRFSPLPIVPALRRRRVSDGAQSHAMACSLCAPSYCCIVAARALWDMHLRCCAHGVQAFNADIERSRATDRAMPAPRPYPRPALSLHPRTAVCRARRLRRRRWLRGRLKDDLGRTCGRRQTGMWYSKALEVERTAMACALRIQCHALCRIVSLVQWTRTNSDAGPELVSQSRQQPWKLPRTWRRLACNRHVQSSSAVTPRTTR